MVSRAWVSWAISANDVVSFLELEDIVVMDSVSFPAASLVKGGRHYSHARIYAGQKGNYKVVAFVSESPPPYSLAKPLAKTRIDW